MKTLLSILLLSGLIFVSSQYGKVIFNFQNLTSSIKKDFFYFMSRTSMATEFFPELKDEWLHLELVDLWKKDWHALKQSEVFSQNQFSISNVTIEFLNNFSKNVFQGKKNWIRTDEKGEHALKVLLFLDQLKPSEKDKKINYIFVIQYRLLEKNSKNLIAEFGRTFQVASP